MTGIWAKDIKKQFTEKETSLANKHRGKLALCVIKEEKHQKNKRNFFACEIGKCLEGANQHWKRSGDSHIFSWGCENQ